MLNSFFYIISYLRQSLGCKAFVAHIEVHRTILMQQKLEDYLKL